MTDIRKKRERILFALTLSALALGAFVSTRFFFKIDLSASKAFTLSSAARSLKNEIPDTVRISYYISKSLRDRHPGPAAIEDFLAELASASKGRIRLRTIDPTRDPSEAESFGVAAQQMQVVERSEQRVALVHSGIVIEYLDRYETLPALIDTATLEYDIIKAIRALVRDKKPAAGILIGDDDKTLDADYSVLGNTLANAGYQVRQIPKASPIDGDLSVLFVLGNAGLDRWDAYFVDQFLMRGGKVFLAVKGVDINPEYGLYASPVPEGGFLGALAAYGLGIERQLVLDQLSLTVPFQTQSPSGGVSIRYVRYPHWIAVDGRNANAGHPIAAGFSGLDLFWPSPLTLASVPGVNAVELFKTGPKAWKQTGDFATAPEESYRYEAERGATEGQYLVAAALSGVFPSAFAAGDLPERDGEAPLTMGPGRSEPTRMVVVSSADFLTDLMRMSGSGFNASVALAAADWLSSDEDLMAIRSRGSADARLNKVSDQATRSFLVTVTYIVNLFLIPAGVVLYGVLRSSRRKRREKSARMEGSPTL